MKNVEQAEVNKLHFWSIPWIGSELSLAVAQSWNLLLISALRNILSPKFTDIDIDIPRSPNFAKQLELVQK